MVQIEGRAFLDDALHRRENPARDEIQMAKDTTGRLHVTVKTGGKRKLSSKLWTDDISRAVLHHEPALYGDNVVAMVR